MHSYFLDLFALFLLLFIRLISAFRATYQVSESAWQPRRSRPTASGGGSGGGSEGSAHPDDSLLNHHQVFEVDHPFMFLVWDYYSGMILLMGRVLNPMQEDPPPS